MFLLIIEDIELDKMNDCILVVKNCGYLRYFD